MLINPNNPVAVKWSDLKTLFIKPNKFEILSSSTALISANEYSKDLLDQVGVKAIKSGDDLLIKLDWWTTEPSDYNARMNWCLRFGIWLGQVSNFYNTNVMGNVPPAMWDYVNAGAFNGFLKIDRDSNSIFIDFGPRGKCVIAVSPDVKTLAALEQISKAIKFNKQDLILKAALEFALSDLTPLDDQSNTRHINRPLRSQKENLTVRLNSSLGKTCIEVIDGNANAHLFDHTDSFYWWWACNVTNS